MKFRTPARILLGVAALAIVVVAAVALARDVIARTALPVVAGAFGYRFAAERVSVGPTRVVLVSPDVRSKRGEPVFRADRVELGLDLHDLVFKGKHLFGLTDVELERPHLTLIHRADGTYNVTLPAGNATQAGPAPGFPLLRVRVRDGSAEIHDATRIYAAVRNLGLHGLTVDATLDPDRPSRYAASLALDVAGRSYPVAARGRLEPARGLEIQRVSAAELPLGPLVNYALNTTSVNVAQARLLNVEACLCGLNGPDGTMQRHLSGTALLQDFTLYLGGLAKPVRAGTGLVRLYDDGVTAPRLRASIADVPVLVAASLYGLSAPTFRLGVTGRGSLERLMSIAVTPGRVRPTGDLAFRLLVEGPAAKPLVLAHLDSTRIGYGAYEIDAVRGLVGLQGTDAEILDAGARYGPLTAGVRGSATLGKHTDFELAARADARAGGLPYASVVAPGMALGATAVFAGTDAKAGASGLASGASATQRLSSTFAIDANGVGSVGPFVLEGPGAHRMYARVLLDRPHNDFSALVDARSLRISSDGARPAALPGLQLAALPRADAVLDAQLLAQTDLHGGAFAGTAGLSLAHLDGADAGTVAVRGSGTLARRGAGFAGAGAAEGRYRGSLDALAARAPALDAHGSLDVPFAVAFGDGRAVGQVRGARFDGVRVRNVPIASLEGTVALRGARYRTIDVYGARANVAGSDVVAYGSVGNGGALAVSASDLDLDALGVHGGLAGGRVSAVASVGGSLDAPNVDAGVVLADGRFRQFAVGASALLAFANGRLDVRDADVAAGPAVASIDGRVDGLGGDVNAARYRMNARVRDADVATLANAARAPLRYPTGTLDADVAVSGRGAAPSVAGSVGLPEGSLNGLHFRNAHVRVSGTAGALRAENGSVTVGSSTVGFAGAFAAGTARASVHAPHLDLADFDDYFDQGDMLGGRGHADVALAYAPNHLSTTGDVALADTHVRRFALGDARATWSTTGRTVRAIASLGGPAGRIAARGAVTLPRSDVTRDAFHRSSLDLTAKAERVDLATWLPTAGIQAPVAGFVNANATVRGVYPALAVTADAALDGGRAGRVPIQRLTVAATASRGRATITNAVFAIANLSANASGTFGLRPQDPFDVTLHAASSDIGALAKEVTGQTADVSGSFDTTAAAHGTLKHPQLVDALDVRALRTRDYTLPDLKANVAYVPGRLTLSSLEADLQRGRLLARGVVPLAAGPPFGLGAANAPVALELDAQQVDVAQFAAALPKGTTLGGLIDGRLALGGTVGAPLLDGTLALANGSFAGPQERAPITNAVATIAFGGTTAQLRDAHATVGGGTLGLSGTASVPDLRDARRASFDVEANAQNAVLDLPQYFRGRVNGTLAFKRTPSATPSLGGSVAFESTRIPLTALFNPSAPQASAAPVLPPVALALAVNVGRDVRVQSGNVDVGAQGAIDVGGTLAKPTLSGKLESTGGSLSFYRYFRVQDGTIAFDPTDGVIPYVDATATTTVPDPQTDVTLHVTGLATQLNVGLASDPNYSREQILGLLVGAQALGAVSGVAASGGGPQGNALQNIAAGQLGTLLTRNLLEPFGSQLGGALGLSNLAVNYAPGQGGLDLSAKKQLFRNVSAVYAQSFNYPQRESVGLRLTPSDATAVQVTYFTQQGSGQFLNAPTALTTTNSSVGAAEPANGQSGYSFSLQRRF